MNLRISRNNIILMRTIKEILQIYVMRTLLRKGDFQQQTLLDKVDMEKSHTWTLSPNNAMGIYTEILNLRKS